MARKNQSKTGVFNDRRYSPTRYSTTPRSFSPTPRVPRAPTGPVYEYHPAGVDQFDPKTNLKPGERVRKTSGGPGAPPNGMMNHSFVEHAETGEFKGLVHNNSLKKT